jgi:toxin ParE1/3/4
MIVNWSPMASRELAAIVDHVAERNPSAADKLEGEILAAAASLSEFPRRGRFSKIAGLREIIVRGRPYFLAYLIGGGMVTIMRVVHHSREWPPPTYDPGS